ncbi:MAG: dTDP-4-dehydrorhamnose reductase, partial [Proteobacteria bacterium]|nr:dTDP-4-dehydrorhamnose reductase [Pseudomonadota bacterium]
MLGTDLCQVLARDHDLVSVDVDDFDVTDAPAVSEFVARHRPE